jgi:hypothetical protein
MKPTPVIRLALWAALCGLALCAPSALHAGRIPALGAIPEALPDATRAPFVLRRQALEGELAAFKAAAAAFNAKSANDQSDADYDALQSERARYIQEAVKFNDDLGAAEGAFTINRMNALAGRLGWDPEKRSQLADALKALHSDGDANATDIQIRSAWQQVLARRQDQALAQEASGGDGLGFPGAGTQTTHEDCAVFALANAAGLPYGVVASRAGELIRQGDWHDAGDRANPQALIEQKGLNGGEVVMLTESFGQAQVVQSSNFPETLKQGRPIMVNVIPPDGDLDAGHEVVLTKTFQHQGETWYVMMDSNQGSQQRLFVSQKELGTMLQENGVAYRPDKGATVKLLGGGASL